MLVNTITEQEQQPQQTPRQRLEAEIYDLKARVAALEKENTLLSLFNRR